MSYPLRFRPAYKPVLWGARNLERLFGRTLPATEPVGESWELADFDDPATGKTWSSVVTNGPLAGRTLRQVIADNPESVFGPGAQAEPFPVLIKLLDAGRDLSVQVHPDEEAARLIGGGAKAKSEWWYILHAEPGATIRRGLKAGTTPDAFRRAVADGTLEEFLITERVAAGDVFEVPAGTVHAIGAGIVLAEVQQPSDTVYRLWDWKRTDPATGKPRELHVEKGLRAIRWEAPPKPTRFREGAPSTRHIAGPHFEVTEHRNLIRREFSTGRDGPVILIGVAGRAKLSCDDGMETILAPGDVVLAPGGLYELVLSLPQAVVLEVKLSR